MGKFVHTLLSPLRAYSAMLLFIIGIVLSYLFVSIQFWSIVGPIFGVVIGTLIMIIGSIYFYFHPSEKDNQVSKYNLMDIRFPVILTSLYVIGLIVLLRSVNYHRPPSLYILFGGYTAIIGYQIARGEPRQRIVPQMIVLAFFIYWSSQFLFPAGMYGPDTVNVYIPSIQSTVVSGELQSELARYGGHLGYVTIFNLIGGLSIRQSYFLLATFLLVGTVMIISIIDNVFPQISQSVAMYAALIFCTSSWMLGRGMHPNKLNFFYALTLLLGLSAFKIYQAQNLRSTTTKAWFVIGFIIGPAITFGHRFSAGAALVFLFSIGVYAILSRTVLAQEYKWVPYGPVLPFIGVYVLQIIGNPLHQGPLLNRLLALVFSIIESNEMASQTTVSSGGPGRYSSQVPLETLLVSTSAQTLLFLLAVIGAIWIFRQSEWEYDFLIFWMGIVSVLLIVSLINNSADVQPHRFYALLVLFGFNVCAGVVLYRLSNITLLDTNHISVEFGSSTVAIIFGIFAITSLASPIADTVTSPVGDNIPHYRQFETNQQIQGEQWVDEYSQTAIEITRPGTDVPIEQISPTRGEVNLSSYDSGTVISYSYLSNRTGVISRDGLALGGRVFIFVDSPQKIDDNQVYTNGESEVFITISQSE